MNKLNIEEFLELRKKVNERPNCIRKGQAWFNELYLYNSELANSIRCTLSDPFYNDKILNSFFNEVCDDDCLKIIWLTF